MAKDIYQVVNEITGGSLGYYSSDTGGQAKRAVVSEIKARKLSGAEIYAVHQAGYGVCNVTDGRIDPTPQADDSQPAI